jgi:hypothetical protein
MMAVFVFAMREQKQNGTKTNMGFSIWPNSETCRANSTQYQAWLICLPGVVHKKTWKGLRLESLLSQREGKNDPHRLCRAFQTLLMNDHIGRWRLKPVLQGSDASRCKLLASNLKWQAERKVTISRT